MTDVIPCEKCACFMEHTPLYVLKTGYAGTCRRMLYMTVEAEYAYVHKHDYCSHAEPPGQHDTRRRSK